MSLPLGPVRRTHSFSFIICPSSFATRIASPFRCGLYSGRSASTSQMSPNTLSPSPYALSPSSSRTTVTSDSDFRSVILKLEKSGLFK